MLLFSSVTYVLISQTIPPGIAIFDGDTNENNAAVTRRDEPPVPQRNMDLIFSSGSTQQQPKAPKPPMVVEGGGGGRAPGREFLRSISSVASSPVSQLPGGTNSNSSSDEKAPMPKMSKKELKLAQNQLNKLTQINIHLHGKRRDEDCGEKDENSQFFTLTDAMELLFPNRLLTGTATATLMNGDI